MSFIEFLENTGCVRQPSQYHDQMRKVPYKIETITGLFLHSLLSYRCHKDFFTDKEQIFYSSDVEFCVPPKAHDAVREHLIVQMLPVQPTSLKIYEPIYQDIRLAVFDFSQQKEDNSYAKYIDSIPDDITKSIQRQEKVQMHQRIARNEELLTGLLQALHSENQSFYAIRLEQQLREYGYKGTGKK